MKQTRGTSDWAYRCNPEGTSLATTADLLEQHHFLWRSLHDGAGRRIPLVQRIEVGDTIHVYFADAGTERYVASYLVERPRELADVDAPAIEVVLGGPLAAKLELAGYKKDPELDRFTGFRVTKDLYPRPVERAPRWIARNAIARVAR